MRRSAIIFLSLWLALPLAARAQPPALPSSAIEQSRVHHQNAVVHFNLDEWKQAADQFKEAYRLHPDPLFLYNIAQCYRKLGEHEPALSFYRKYARAAPRASNRAEVKRRITELEALLAASSKAREAPPASVIPPSQRSAPAPVASAVTAPPSIVVSPPALSAPRQAAPAGGLLQTMPAADSTPPVYKRWWFWAGVGAVVAAGVTVAIVAGSPATRSNYQGDIPPGRITVPGQ